MRRVGYGAPLDAKGKGRGSVGSLAVDTFTPRAMIKNALVRKDKGGQIIGGFEDNATASETDAPPYGPWNASGIKPCGLRVSEDANEQSNIVESSVSCSLASPAAFSKVTKPVASEAELMAVVPDAAFSSSTPPSTKTYSRK